jgi:hypothetical protein
MFIYIIRIIENVKGTRGSCLVTGRCGTLAGMRRTLAGDV